jgi:hypothetical protein
MKKLPLRTGAVTALALGCLLALPASSADPIPLAASQWRGTGVGKLKGVSPLASPRPLAFVLSLGPLADPPLASDAFELLLTDGGAVLPIEGRYSLDAKGRPELVPDLPALIAALDTALLESCGALDDPSGCAQLQTLDLVPSKLKLKLKAGAKNGVEALQASLKLSSAWLDPSSGKAEVKLSVSFKDNGDAVRQ